MTTPAWTLRPFQSDDLPLLAELARTTFEAAFGAQNTPEDMAQYLDSSFSIEQLRKEVSAPNSSFLVAVEHGSLVGYAKLQTGPSPDCVPGESAVELARLYVESSAIGTGLGSALMEACLNEARKSPHSTLWLGVWERNPRAIAFYERWGFETVGEHSFKLGEDLQRDVMMSRTL